MEHQLLTDVMPREKDHEFIVDGLAHGTISYLDIVPHFHSPEGFRSDLFYLTAHLASHRRAGRWIYHVPKDVQRALAEVPANTFGPEDFTLPRTTFYVSLPDCEQEIWGGPTGWHRVHGVFLTHMRGRKITYEAGSPAYQLETAPDDSEGILNIFVWGPENENSRFPGDDANFWLTLDLGGPDSFEGQVRRLLSRDGQDYMSGMPEGSRRKKLEEQLLRVIRIALNSIRMGNLRTNWLRLDSKSRENLQQREELYKALERAKSSKKKKRLIRMIEKVEQDRHMQMTTDVFKPFEGGPVPPGKWEPNLPHLRKDLAHAKHRVQCLVASLTASKENLALATPAEVPNLTLEVLEHDESLTKALKILDTAESRLEEPFRLVLPHPKGEEPIIIATLQPNQTTSENP